MEAVCFQLAGGLDEVEGSTGEALEAVLNGGAIERSPWWQQRLASTLGRPVTVSTVPETTARGAAANALGVDLAAGELEGQKVDPVPAEVPVLGAARLRWAAYTGPCCPSFPPAILGGPLTSERARVTMRYTTQIEAK